APRKRRVPVALDWKSAFRGSEVQMPPSSIECKPYRIYHYVAGGRTNHRVLDMYVVRATHNDGGIMIHDTLDDLLDRSAPASRPAAQGDLDAMIAEAFQSAPRTVRPRILIAAGLAAVFA